MAKGVTMKKRLVVGISGASGVIYGVRMLGLLKETDFETHLIISDSGRRNIEIETDFKAGDVAAMADHVYEDRDVRCVRLQINTVTAEKFYGLVFRIT